MRPLKTALLALVMCPALCLAKTEIPIRTMSYFPDGRDIVCLNGENRYTRGLYGTHTRFRLETSDRPVFATYDKLDSYNFRFFLSVGGTQTQLDSTDWCEARYRGGYRIYTLKDESWGGGTVKLTAMASFSSERAIWRFELSGFDSPVSLRALKVHIAGTSFTRDGDLGIDPREAFDPSDSGEGLQDISWEPESVSYCIYDHRGELFVPQREQGDEIFAREQELCSRIMDQVVIDTPDPFFNTLGVNLMAAADGIYDGKTVLHGANGWRTTYAGWRGGYINDVVGWNERAKSHFRAYSKSMVRDVPPIYDHPQQDPEKNLCRSAHVWGTPMYSNGYICRLPERTDQMSHYDMNLNFIDELMTHFCYDADTSFMREMWPTIVLHHEWEKRNFDPDGDHLYDAYCCIWASDALYYNSGAVTHSSAYNYRANLLTARIAELIGEDPEPYRREAEAILEAMNSRLWMEDRGHWAEYQDFMGYKRLHKSAAIWSIYTPIDCEACTPEQAFRATRYVDECIPRIPVRFEYDKKAAEELGLSLPKISDEYFTISTTDWLPYVWSTNNVAHEEVANMALAYLQAGRNDSGFQLLKSDLLDAMYLGQCPGNFGQISYYDKAKNEAYRDFADNVGTTSRAIINGLFGIIPDAMNGKCVIKPAFPDDWDEASVKTPYLSYRFHREGHFDVYEIEQNFPQDLRIIVRTNAGGGAYLQTEGTSERSQVIRVDRRKLPKALKHKDITASRKKVSSKSYMKKMGLGDISARVGRKSVMVDISSHFNSNVDDIFRNEYLSPRSPYTTLSLPKQGVGEWCIPDEMHTIEDDGFRASIRDGVFDTGLGLRFLSPAEGHNIVYTSLWDNYPESVTIPLEGRARYAYLLMAGSTNSMQSRIENGTVTVTYADGSCDIMSLENPINWCPIEQDYYTDDYAFWSAPKKPYRVLLDSGLTSRELNIRFRAAAENDMQLFDAVKTTDRVIENGAAQILKFPLKRFRKLKSITVSTLSNDVVIGLMGITLEK